ncbi:MAG: sensor histidine kinase [Lachnospirales bacterium]
MIRKLRRKFIAANMLLVTLVLLIVFAVLVGTHSRQLADQSMGAMRMALKWSEGYTPPRLEIGSREEMPQAPSPGDGKRDFTMVPVFSVTLAEDGSIRSLNQGNNVSVDKSTLDSAVAEVLTLAGDAGRLNGYDLRYLRETDSAGVIRIAFADRGWENDSIGQLVLTCLVVGLLGLAGFFLISLFLANLSLRPAEKAWQQQRQFVADASHELKTPITVILANTGIVLAHRPDSVESQVKWITYIQDEAERMKSLVEDLLFLAKSDAARLPLHLTEVRLSEVVTGSLLPLESVAFEKGVSLSEHVTSGLTLLGDDGQLRRLMVILLDNAIKYAGERGAVTVTLDRQGEKLRLSVHNTGPAIPAEHLPHLFERFYQADAARDRDQGGYGLGLAIARSIAETHGGRITVVSTPEAGTTFTVILPKK